MEIPKRREVINPGRGSLGLAEELSRAEDRSDLGHERRLHGFAPRRARAVERDENSITTWLHSAPASNTA